MRPRRSLDVAKWLRPLLVCRGRALPFGRTSGQITQQSFDLTRSAGSFPNFNIYRPREIGPANLSDTPRLDQMIRDGKLYLSLSDALAIALENNLDIAVSRYGPLEADTDILRARAGQNLSGVQTQISTLSTQSSAQGGGGGGQQGAPGQATGVFSGAGDAAQAASGGGDTGSASSFFGTQVTALDPVVTSSMFWTRQSNPQISNFVTGTNTLIQDFGSYQFNVSKGFTTGTTVNLGFTNFNQSNNNLRNNLNPTISSELNLSDPPAPHPGFRTGHQRAADPRRQQQPRGAGPAVQRAGHHHGFADSESLLGPGQFPAGGRGAPQRPGARRAARATTTKRRSIWDCWRGSR